MTTTNVCRENQSRNLLIHTKIHSRQSLFNTTISNVQNSNKNKNILKNIFNRQSLICVKFNDIIKSYENVQYLGNNMNCIYCQFLSKIYSVCFRSAWMYMVATSITSPDVIICRKKVKLL